MDTATIKEQLHNYLEIADDKKLKAIYVMVEDEIKESSFEYTDDLKKELDTRYASYKKGTTNLITAAESKRRINKLLSKAKQKWVINTVFTSLAKKTMKKRYCGTLNKAKKLRWAS